MKCKFLITLLLVTEIIVAQKVKKVNFTGYTAIGFNYGNSSTVIKNPFIQMCTKPTPAASFGVQLRPKNSTRFIDVQFGVATVNNYLKMTSGNTYPNLSNDDLGNTSTKAIFFDGKISINQFIKLTTIKKTDIVGVVGIGVRYASRKSTILDEKIELTSSGFKQLMIANNARFTDNSWEKTYPQIGVIGYSGIRLQQATKPLYFEAFWSPAITAASIVTYQLDNPSFPSGNGNSKQMLHNTGLKILYRFGNK